MSKLVRAVSSVDEPLSPVPQILSNGTFLNHNFSGVNFHRKDMRRSRFIFCRFDDADMSEADCTGADFTGSSFRRTNCRGTNFKDAKLGRTIFEPSDFYEMTMTFTCATFQGMKIGKPVWDAYLFFALGLMDPPKDSDGFDPRAVLIAAMGNEYYVSLAEKFKNRTL